MAIKIKNWNGIAFRVVSTSKGKKKVVMIGDDRIFEVRAEDCTPIKRSEYCCVCGQMGCTHNQ